jgi:hypothetical protein
MRPKRALGLAVRDMYANSWRLVPLNAALGAVLVLACVSALTFPGALMLILLAGPIAAALVHCAVTLSRTGNLAFSDGITGLRLHWRRGFGLGAAGCALFALGAIAVHVYGRTALWPLSFVTIYALVLSGIFQLVLWTIAIAEPSAPLRFVARDAARFIAARPWATLALGLALLVINLAGIAAALMPFLTLTVAFSFVAAAHFVLEER